MLARDVAVAADADAGNADIRQRRRWSRRGSAEPAAFRKFAPIMPMLGQGCRALGAPVARMDILFVLPYVTMDLFVRERDCDVPADLGISFALGSVSQPPPRRVPMFDRHR
jgi:hypothetical protein